VNDADGTLTFLAYGKRRTVYPFDDIEGFEIF
jgi:hypothetical protein